MEEYISGKYQRIGNDQCSKETVYGSVRTGGGCLLKTESQGEGVSGCII